jgi:hypothetical protein
MAANSSVVLTSLDFDSYKQSLKAYLSSQDAFKDYDYNNSNMSVLLDLLSHNTYMNAFYMNMVSSEMFLDSAQLRDSVISHAKELNYLPRSFKSAVAQVNIAIDTGVAGTSKTAIMVPKGTQFISRVGDIAYTFVTAEDIVTSVVNGRYFYANGVKIYEGDYSSDTHIINYDNNLIYKISSNRVDVSSIIVRVIENNGTDILTYTRATSLFGLDSASKVFFVQPALNGEYEIVFGDGVVGRKPLNNSVVLIEYRVCSGELPNGANKFYAAGRIDNEANISVTTTSAASDGEVAETLASIKYNAPRAFTTQERAITAEDYENILKLNYPEINSVVAYGGEDANPPQYGRIFISIDLKNIDGLPQINEMEYKKFLRTRSSVSMDPIFISPDYIYLNVKSNIKYNINVTGRNPDDIRTLVTRSILQYAITNLNSFAKTLRYSKLIKDIDAAEASIVSNETTVSLVKYITPALNINQNLTIDFKSPLTNEIPLLGDEHPIIDVHAITSTPFTYSGINNCTIEDNGDGIVRIVTPSGINHKKIIDIGTVNYDTGLISLNSFNISNFAGTSLKIFAIPRNKDIESVQNVILNIIEPDIDITIEQIRE